MSHFGLKISKSEGPDKTPYTVYYPHRLPASDRNWNQEYYQLASIDPGRKNYALRIERRYHNGWITPVVFDKVAIESFQEQDGVIICHTYRVLTDFLAQYDQFFLDCHFIIIERQLPQNYKATRIAQHTISYFNLLLRNRPLLPAIIEVDPKLKGKRLGAPKGLSDKQLKTWAVEKARELLTIRLDQFSLDVLDRFRNKQDDLSDTVCQIEALFNLWGLPCTVTPPRPTTVEVKLPKLTARQQQTSILSLVNTAPTTIKPLSTLNMNVEVPTSLMNTIPMTTKPLSLVISKK